MNQSSQETLEVLNGGAGSDEARNNNPRSLMVRESENHVLSPYALPSAGTPYFDVDAGGVNLVQLLHSLRRRWLLALCAGLMMGLPVAIVVWLIAPDPYEVAAWLHVGDPQNLQGGPLSRNASEYEQFRKTQAALIKSPQVLRGALDVPGIAELPILRDKREPQKYLEDEVAIVAPMDQELLQIKMRGKDAQQLVKIVNAVKQSYLDNIVNADHIAKLRNRELVENSYKETMVQMQKKRELLDQLLKQYNAPDLQQVKIQSQLLIQQSYELSRQVMDCTNALTAIQGKIAILKQRDPSSTAPSEHLIDLALARDPSISNLHEQIMQYQQVLTQHLAQTKRGPRDPTAQRYQSTIESLRKQLEERRAELRPGIIQQFASEMGNSAADLQKLEAQETVQIKAVEEAERQYKDVAQKAAELTNENSQHVSLVEEIHQLESNAQQRYNDLERLKLELSMPQRVVSLQDASVPEGTNPVLRYILTMFAGIVGLALGAGAVVAVEYQAHRLNTTSEMGTKAGLRVLGTVPNIAALSRSKKLSASGVMHGVLAESLDSVRTMLLQQSRDVVPQIILVTSAGDREGKTTVASHLAASLARSGRRTLLVDGDLRSPTAHLVFGTAGDPGLCEVLRGEVELAAALQPTSVDGLMLVAGGQCDYAAIAALSKNVLADVLQAAREQFEFIVIDASPVLTYADALLVSSHADAAVLSVRRDVSRIHKVNEARDRMESVGIRVLGAVVNGITENSRRPAYALPASE